MKLHVLYNTEVYNKLVMHIKWAGWRVSNASHPSFRNKPWLIIIHHHTAHWADEHTWATSHTQGEASIVKLAVRMVRGHRGKGGATIVGPQDRFPLPCTLFLPPLLLIYLFVLMRREHNKESGKTVKTSPRVQFTFIVWTCVPTT